MREKKSKNSRIQEAVNVFQASMQGVDKIRAQAAGLKEDAHQRLYRAATQILGRDAGSFTMQPDSQFRYIIIDDVLYEPGDPV